MKYLISKILEVAKSNEVQRPDDTISLDQPSPSRNDKKQVNNSGGCCK